MYVKGRFIAAAKEHNTFEKPVNAPYFRTDFTVSGRVKTARLTITGLGYYEAYSVGRVYLGP